MTSIKELNNKNMWLTDFSNVIQNRNNKSLQIIDEVISKMNECAYFTPENHDDVIIDKLDVCIIKLHELGSIIRENNDELIEFQEETL